MKSNAHLVRILAGASILAASSLAAAANVTYSFQNGVAGYTGTQDTELRSNTGETGLVTGGNDAISIDGDDGSPGLKPNHMLIRFDDIFGNGTGQIKATDTIVNAKITLTVFDAGSGFTVHDMLANWNESTATWDAFTGGVQGDGAEAGTTILATFGADNSTANVTSEVLTFDVTSSLQAVKAGTLPGNGWALLPFPNGTNGVDVWSSEAGNLANRPLLEVEVMPVPEPGTYALLLAGLGLVGAAGARRSRR